jgi:site-specific DNA-cytosine methylase
MILILYLIKSKQKKIQQQIGLINLKKHIKMKENKDKKLKALVLCCGAGLTTIALKQANFNVLGGIDISDSAEKIYQLNIGSSKYIKQSVRRLNLKKICEFLGVEPGEIDFIQISNPCTDTSKASNQEIFSAVNGLYFVCLKLALALNPKAIVFENVDALAESNVQALLAMLNAFMLKYATNYHFEARILNSYNYGDPQARLRIFLELLRKDIGLPVWPSPVEESERKSISDIIPDADYVVSSNWGDIMYLPHQPLPTITGHSLMRVSKGGVIQKVTPQEYALGMGLSNDFKLVGSEADQILAIGNGVCVSVMQKIAEAIADRINETQEMFNNNL